MDPILIPILALTLGISLGFVAVVGHINVKPWIERLVTDKSTRLADEIEDLRR